MSLTTLTLRITEDSAKQFVINPLFTEISIIRLIGEENVSYVSPAHSEIITFCENVKERSENMTF